MKINSTILKMKKRDGRIVEMEHRLRGIALLDPALHLDGPVPAAASHSCSNTPLT